MQFGKQVLSVLKMETASSSKMSLPVYKITQMNIILNKLYILHPVVSIISYGFDHQHNNKARKRLVIQLTGWPISAYLKE
jgi:hypothetical protein